jgi:NAD(P)-dependent dehydrogenase (short-subunit alcohol dehydrogenase family)
MDVRNKVVLVTGASSGIGLATARRLAAAGAKVALAARSADKLEQVTEELKKAGHEALAVPTDMRSADQVKRFVEEAFRHFGRVDILVNNAGQGMAAPVESASFQDFQSLIELNVFGPLRAMQAAIPLMRRGGGGVIANVSSMVSKMHIPGLGAYAATKAALNLLSETARYELEHDGIKVITVFPRTTATDFGKNSIGDQRLRQHQRSTATSSSPVDTPDYVAGRILQALETETPEQYMDH